MQRRSYEVHTLSLDPKLAQICEQDYPRFSGKEIERRRQAMAEAMRDASVDHLIVYGAGFRGGAVHWLSDWLTTHEAVQVFTPGRKDTIFIHFYNHLPQAERLMPEIDMKWGGPSTIDSVIGELRRRQAKVNRIGTIGAMPLSYVKGLMVAYGEIADLTGAYMRLRMVKSEEEVERARIGACMSDQSIAALVCEIRPGLTPRDLGAIIEGAYLPWAGTNVIHFIGVTAMDHPDVYVPCQHPSTRRIRPGDVVTCEISANFWEYGGQVLRTIAVSGELNPLFRRLHDTADKAFEEIVKVLRPGSHAREIVAASKVIEAAGFTICDDLVQASEAEPSRFQECHPACP